jgi:hypothetical protein
VKTLSGALLKSGSIEVPVAGGILITPATRIVVAHVIAKTQWQPFTQAPLGLSHPRPSLMVEMQVREGRVTGASAPAEGIAFRNVLARSDTQRPFSQMC